MNVQVRRQNPTYPPDVTMSLVGKEMYVCIGGDVCEIPYMYAVAWRDGGFEGFRALTCTFTVPLVLAPCWICWITRPDLHKHWRPRGHRSSGDRLQSTPEPVREGGRSPPRAGYPTWPNWPSVQVRLGFWALAPTRSTPSAPHERAGQEAKSHISPRCNYVSSRERDVCMYRGRCLRDPLHVCSGMA